MRVSIRGKRWKMKFLPLKNRWGEADAYPPHPPGKEIRINSRHPDQEEALNTVLHEVTHCAFPDLREEVVTEFADDLTKILTQLGWRLPVDEAEQ